MSTNHMDHPVAQDQDSCSSCACVHQVEGSHKVFVLLFFLDQAGTVVVGYFSVCLETEGNVNGENSFGVFCKKVQKHKTNVM